jgi:hypothetical protein
MKKTEKYTYHKLIFKTNTHAFFIGKFIYGLNIIFKNV